MPTNKLPNQFLDRLGDIVGQSLFSQIEKTFTQRPTTFRVNPLKHLSLAYRQAGTQAPEHFVSEILRENGFKVRNVPWYSDAFILQNKSKRELMELPIYTEGKIYIQSLASMVPPLVLGPKPGETVLDLTAAPGSKTSQIAALMHREGLPAEALAKAGELIANDNNKVRFFKLKHNMEFLGVDENERVTFESSRQAETLPQPSPTRGGRFLTLRMEDGSHLCGEYPNYFDKILLDAPCSAEARFIAGDPKTYGYWSEKKIKDMAYKQRKLLFSAWHALKPGGTLVYSTCTFAPEENEVQISRLLERYDDVETEDVASLLSGLKTMPPLKVWKGKALHPGVQKAIRIFPTSEIEGFFVARLRKK
ncbi:MAG: RsmB/NOP family class I SAM-dependent RNA methyltransferase [Patescibacteria group bacterium]